MGWGGGGYTLAMVEVLVRRGWVAAKGWECDTNVCTAIEHPCICI